ncbi:helix-turn-helix domain-containing protein [bacterium]|nr:helix-turn-helix domain-containing protein [bacterium]MDY3022408.1 helix-turn-helix transcriptional regulator [Oliverpabstia sp.]
MNSVERVKRLCKEKKLPISRLEKELGFSNGYIGQLRKGVFPDDRLKMIADYFGVTVDYLMTGNEKSDFKESNLTLKDEKDIAKDLENIMRKLSNNEDGPASFEGTDIPEADQELFAGQIELMLRRLKAINKDLYNPNKNKK